MKRCDSCGQEKPYDPSARPRSKAHGFYDWRCWDCYKTSASKRNTVQSTEYEVLQSRALVLSAELAEVRAQMQELLKAQKQKNHEAQQTRKRLAEEAKQVACQYGVGKKFVTKHGETLIVTSLPYKVMVQELQRALEALPQDPELQHKLGVAQNKLAKFGPDAFDFRAAE